MTAQWISFILACSTHVHFPNFTSKCRTNNSLFDEKRNCFGIGKPVRASKPVMQIWTKQWWSWPCFFNNFWTYHLPQILLDFGSSNELVEPNDIYDEAHCMMEHHCISWSAEWPEKCFKGEPTRQGVLTWTWICTFSGKLAIHFLAASKVFFSSMTSVIP